MLRISETVREIVLASEVARTALVEGYLNLSAYAKVIRPQVEARTFKPASIPSIVVALSRLAATMHDSQPLVPAVCIQDIAVRSGLIEFAFARAPDTKECLKLLYQDKRFTAAEFFTVTHGIGELSIVVPAELHDAVVRIYKNHKAKLFLKNLASVTVRFDHTYIQTPNTTFAFLRPLALERINVVEMFSTFTELTFILNQADLERAFLILNRAFSRAGVVKAKSRDARSSGRMRQ
jgi:hypothetical protein